MTIPPSVRAPIRRLAVASQRAIRVRPKVFCLVTGAPRSGTTALDDWLHEHKHVTGASESRILVAAYRFLEAVRRFKYLHENEGLLTKLARRLVYSYYGHANVLIHRSVLLDKEPLEPVAFPDESYAQFIDCMNRLLPNVRFIFMLRDPVATIWSMRSRKWGYTVDDMEPREYPLDQHIKTWKLCAELILAQRSRINAYVCRFDRLIEDPEGESRRICDFLQLELHEAFVAKRSLPPGFSDAELQQIRDATSELWTRLTST